MIVLLIEVHMFDAMSLTSVNSFMAHANPLSALRFNAEGTKIATASTKVSFLFK